MSAIIFCLLAFPGAAWLVSVVSAIYVRSFASAEKSCRLARHYGSLAERLMRFRHGGKRVRSWLLFGAFMLAPPFGLCLCEYGASCSWLPLVLVFAIIAMVDFGCELIPDAMALALVPSFWIAAGFPEWDPALVSCAVFFLFWKFGLNTGDFKLLCAVSAGAGGTMAMLMAMVSFLLRVTCGKLTKGEIPFGPFANLAYMPAILIAKALEVDI